MFRKLFRQKNTEKDKSFILSTIELIAENPEKDNDELVESLVSYGVNRTLSERLIHFVPMACCRAWLEPSGIQFTDTYILMNLDTKEKVTEEFRNEPIFQEALRIATNELKSGIEKQRLINLACRTAEYDAINQLLESGSRAEDIVLSRPVLLDIEF